MIAEYASSSPGLAVAACLALVFCLLVFVAACYRALRIDSSALSGYAALPLDAPLTNQAKAFAAQERRAAAE